MKHVMHTNLLLLCSVACIVFFGLIIAAATGNADSSSFCFCASMLSGAVALSTGAFFSPRKPLVRRAHAARKPRARRGEAANARLRPLATRAVSAVVSLVLVLGMMPATAFAAPEPGGSNGADLSLPEGINSKNWMGYIPDYANIAQINMPGSHDSATANLHYVGAKYWLSTQDYSIDEQLDMGVRVFDIRMTWDDRKDDNLVCKHGPAYCYKSKFERLKLSDVTNWAVDFVTANPTETVVFFLQQEDGDKDKYEEEIDSRMRTFKSTKRADGTNQYIVLEDVGQGLPTMGNARGRVVVIKDTDLIYKYEDHDTVGDDEKVRYLKTAWDAALDQDYAKDCVLSGREGADKKGQKIDPLVIFTNNRWGGDTPHWRAVHKLINEDYEFVQGKRYGWMLNNFADATVSKSIWQTNAFEPKNTDMYWGYRDRRLYLSSKYSDETPNPFSSSAVFTGSNLPPWSSNASHVAEVRVLDEIAPKNTAYWFADMGDLWYVDMQNIDLRHVQSTKAMFSGCKWLRGSLDLTRLGVANLSDCSNMFDSCIRLETIYVNESFDVKSNSFLYGHPSLCADMFANCPALVGSNGTTWRDTLTSGLAGGWWDGKNNRPGLMSIKSFDATVSSDPYVGNYDGLNHVPTVTLRGDAEGASVEFEVDFLGMKRWMPSSLCGKFGFGVSKAGVTEVRYRVSKAGYQTLYGTEYVQLFRGDLSLPYTNPTEGSLGTDTPLGLNVDTSAYAGNDTFSLTWEWDENDPPDEFDASGKPLWSTVGDHSVRFTAMVTEPYMHPFTAEGIVSVKPMPGAPNPEIKGAGTYVYDGSEHMVYAQEGPGTTKDARFAYSMSDTGPFTEDFISQTEVGDYAYYIEVVDPNFETSRVVVPAHLTITPASIADDDVRLSKNFYTYTGSDISVDFAVVCGEGASAVTLVEGRDYDVYVDAANNIQRTAQGIDGQNVDYALRIVGKGNYSGVAEQTWTIGKESLPEVLVTPYEGVYDGAAHVPTFELPTGYPVTLYYGTDPNDITMSDCPNFTDAGNHAIYYRAEASGYWPLEGSTYVEIDQKTISDGNLVLTPAAGGAGTTLPYNGEVQYMDYTVTSDGTTLVEDADFQVLIAQTSGCAIGTYTVALMGEGNYTGFALQEWEIVPGDLGDAVTVTGYDDVYDGLSHGITVDLSGKAMGATVTYSENVNGPFSATCPTYTDVSTHTVYYKVQKTGYNDLTGNMDVTILPKPLTDDDLLLMPQYFTYTGDAFAPSVSVSSDGLDLVEGVDYAVDASSVLSASAAGDYAVKVNGSGNFTGSAEVAWHIVNGELPFSENDYVGVYDGEEHAATITLNAPLSSKNATITYGMTADSCTETDPFAYVDAGYYLSYYLVTFDDGTQPLRGVLSVAIVPQEVTVQAYDRAKRPGEAEPALGCEITGVVAGESVDYQVKRDPGEDPGEYRIYVEIDEALYPNYDFTFKDGTLYIANDLKGVTSSGYQGAFDNQPHGITVSLSGEAEDATVMYSLDGFEYTSDCPTFTDVCHDAEVFYRVTKDGYFDVNGCELVNIEPRELTADNVVVDPESFTYDGESHTPSIRVTFEGSELEEGWDYIVDADASVVEATEPGTYTIAVSGVGNFGGTVVKQWSIVADYQIVQGAEQVWTKGSSEGAAFRSTAPYRKFASVEVDGITVNPANYTTAEGSTIVNLAPAFLETLTVGRHTLTVRATDGSASCGFYVARPAILATGDGVNVVPLVAAAVLALCLAGAVMHARRRGCE